VSVGAAIAVALATATLAACKSFYLRDADATGEGGASGVDGSASDGAATHWCAERAATLALCDDFDTGDAPGTPAWTATNQVGGVATLSLESGDSTSAPRSLLVVKPTSDPTLNVESWLQKVLPSEPAGVLVSFDVRIDDLGEGFNLAVLHQGHLDLVLAQYSADQTTLREEATGGGLLKEDPASSAIVPGEWRHVELDGAFAERRVRVTINGAKVVDASFDASAVATGSPASVGLGIVYVQGASRLQVRYDDVTVALR